MAGKRSLWEERLAVLRSLDLAGVARQVNAARLKRAVLEGERLTALPSARRCNAPQMKRVLEALIEECGRSAQAAVSYRRLGRRLGASRNTIQRAIAGLREAWLVRVESRESPSQGSLPCLFAPSWPNLIDVARSQGLQGELFDDRPQPAVEKESAPPQRPDAVVDDVCFAGGGDGSAAAVTPGGSRPTRLSATGHSPPPGETESVMGGGASHVGGPPSHDSPADFLSARARTRALESSPRRGEEKLEEEENNSLLLHSSNRDHADLRARLEAYGVQPTIALRAAGDNGWSDQQVAALLAWCETQVIDGVKAFGAPLIFRHLERFPPGAAITIAPREEFTRAKRDRSLRIAAARKATEDAALAAEKSQRPIDKEKAAAWQARLARHAAARNAEVAADDADGRG